MSSLCVLRFLLFKDLCKLQRFQPLVTRNTQRLEHVKGVLRQSGKGGRTSSSGESNDARK
jgi:hypothetical protein